jgi:hypothetical protein
VFQYATYKKRVAVPIFVTLEPQQLSDGTLALTKAFDTTKSLLVLILAIVIFVAGGVAIEKAFDSLRSVGRDNKSG